MNELQSPEVNTALVRRFGIRNRIPVASLSSDLQPVVIVDDVRPGPRTASGAAKVTTGAGGAAGIQLFNPVESGFILVARRLRFSTSATGQTWLLRQADLAHLHDTLVVAQTGYTNRELSDGPGGTCGVPVGQLRIDADPLGGILFGEFDIAHAAQGYVDLPIYHRLRPGTGISIIGPTAGPYSMVAWYEWEEEPDNPEK